VSLLDSGAIPHRHLGFVAMEYFALILNRSYLVFITPEGLHGWKFTGPVSTASPRFYEPFEALLDLPELAPGSAEFNSLMSKRGSFFIPQSQISSVEFVGESKWGMGPIQHSGKLYIKLLNGKKREFVLLGNAYGDGLCRAILAGGRA
jgi:hypothetical protein